MVRSRYLFIIVLVATAHLSLTAYALLASFYLIVPGEPGFDPELARRATFFGHVLSVVGFPVLPFLLRLPASPLADGILGWFWLALNSLVWSAAIVSLTRLVATRFMRSDPNNVNAA
jgi:hypothetical protein